MVTVNANEARKYLDQLREMRLRIEVRGIDDERARLELELNKLLTEFFETEARTGHGGIDE